MKVSLKAARINRNLKQSEAAEQIGVSKATISKWERGVSVPNVKLIPCIEKVYGVSYDELSFFTQK
ncbi:MAG: helix-turn-helix transcriptional regulator [Clostridia bacterium]|nr:helix-turn-helix transcriptional regulator [Clostridia bacterium]